MESAKIRDNCTILLVDDEEFSRKLLENRLRKLPYATVIGFPNGLSAKKYLLEHVADIVITDIQMPFMDGLELVGFISRFCPDCQRVIISGYGEFEYAKRAIQYGVKDYLLKPVQLQNLENIVEACRQQVLQNRIAQVTKQYNAHKNLEQKLDNFLKGNAQTKEIEELEQLLTHGGTVIGLRSDSDGKEHTEQLGIQYRNLIGGALQTYTILSLGRKKGEYRYLILPTDSEEHRSLAAIPEYLGRILTEAVCLTQIGSVETLQQLLELDPPSPLDECNAVIERACQFIQAHLGEPISRNEVAEHVYLSSSHFGHLFKQVMGMGYNAYLTQMRIEQAKKMLRKNMLVAEVAAAVGYRDAKYFSEIFYQKTGCVPSEYKYQFTDEDNGQDDET